MLIYKIFDAESKALRAPIQSLITGSVDDLIEEAKSVYEKMIPIMPYTDDEGHAMAAAVFNCCSYLAIYISLRSRGGDAHTW